jgi:heat shock protein HtpX
MLNTLKVGALLVAMTGLFIAIGAMIGGKGGVLIAFGMAVLMNVGSFWFSDKIVLKMTGAQPVGPNEAPELYRMTEDLARLAKMPMPALYIINDPQPNAFATGRSPNHAAVAVNTGLLNILDKREVAGVVAHELAHIKHRDTLTMTIVATMAGAIMTIVQIAQFSALFGMGGNNNDDEGVNPIVMIAMMIVGPLAATLIQMAVSRAREFEADRLAAELTGSPDGLINSLLKLERGAQAIPTHSMSPQNAHMCIVNPLRGMGGVTALFSTHPPIEKRVAALEALRGRINPQNDNPWG